MSMRHSMYRPVQRVNFVDSHWRAIQELEQYARDDAIEAERLHPFLAAAKGRRPRVKRVSGLLNLY